MKSDFVPRQMRPYRVPYKFKPEVDRQFTELFEMGLIHPSDSPMVTDISRTRSWILHRTRIGCPASRTANIMIVPVALVSVLLAV